MTSEEARDEPQQELLSAGESEAQMTFNGIVLACPSFSSSSETWEQRRQKLREFGPETPAPFLGEQTPRLLKATLMRALERKWMGDAKCAWDALVVADPTVAAEFMATRPTEEARALRGAIHTSWGESAATTASPALTSPSSLEYRQVAHRDAGNDEDEGDEGGEGSCMGGGGASSTQGGKKKKKKKKKSGGGGGGGGAGGGDTGIGGGGSGGDGGQEQQILRAAESAMETPSGASMLPNSPLLPSPIADSSGAGTSGAEADGSAVGGSGIRDSKALVSMVNRGMALRLQGDLEGATHLLRDVLKDCLATLGNRHPTTLMAESELAVTLGVGSKCPWRHSSPFVGHSPANSGSGSGGGSSGGGGGGAAEVGLSGVDLDRREIARFETLFQHGNDAGWLAFSSQSARWVPFSVDPEMQRAFTDGCRLGNDNAEVTKWLHRAESSVELWIVRLIMKKEKRPDLFRSLGRGWILIHLWRAQSKFKWWFESIDRVLRNHQDDISAIKLDEHSLAKYTRGYMCQSEIVFMMRGLVPNAFSPTICIMKLASDYVHKDKWGGQDVQKAIMTPMPTDAERQAHAWKVEKAGERKKKTRQRKAEAAMAAREAADKEAGERDATTFEQLLAEFKEEDAARAEGAGAEEGSEASGETSNPTFGDDPGF